jgi:hypothetical protein
MLGSEEEAPRTSTWRFVDFRLASSCDGGAEVSGSYDQLTSTGDSHSFIRQIDIVPVDPLHLSKSG